MIMLINLKLINFNPQLKNEIEFISEKVFQSLNVDYNISELKSYEDINISILKHDTLVFAGSDFINDFFKEFIDTTMISDYKARIIVFYSKEENLHFLLPVRSYAYINCSELEKGIIEQIAKFVNEM